MMAGKASTPRPTSPPGIWRIRQRYVLAVLYYSTGGEGWKNRFGYLNASLHECDWGGVWNGWMSTDCNEDMEITLVNLWQNDLRGTIPRELAGLPSLDTIDFLTNKLEGSVPEELATAGLNYLNLGYNRLAGTVHASYGDMTEITYLMLDYNDLVGSIPSELGRMTQLSGWLSLEGNDLTGTIPESFANFTEAAWIYLNGNRLTGSAEFLCDALNPSMGPNATESSEESPLLELWVDRDEVTCSCCNCCPMVED